MASSHRSRTSALLVPLIGLVGGLSWGVFARVWMRFIATDPEYTAAGTIFVIGAFGVVGLTQSFAHLGRRAELRRPAMTVLRIVTSLGLLPLGIGAGAMMLPTVIIAPLALTQHRWPTWQRAVAGAVASVGAVVTVGQLLSELPWWRALIGSLWFVVVYAGIIGAARCSLAPQEDGWRAPRAARVAGGGTFALALGAAAMAVIGL